MGRNEKRTRNVQGSPRDVLSAIAVVVFGLFVTATGVTTLGGGGPWWAYVVGAGLVVLGLGSAAIGVLSGTGVGPRGR